MTGVEEDHYHDGNLLTKVEVLECCQWNVLVWLSGRLCWACAELESAH